MGLANRDKAMFDAGVRSRGEGMLLRSDVRSVSQSRRTIQATVESQRSLQTVPCCGPQEPDLQLDQRSSAIYPTAEDRQPNGADALPK